MLEIYFKKKKLELFLQLIVIETLFLFLYESPLITQQFGEGAMLMSKVKAPKFYFKKNGIYT
jgi:hypothetical protein